MIDEKKLIKAIFNTPSDHTPKIESCLYLDGYYDGKMQREVEIVKVIESCRKTDWIPCEERLPECEWGGETKALMFQIKNSDYIEVGHYGEGGKYRDRYFRTYTDTLEGYEASDVIAWMPLPQPYKKEGAENE